VTRITHGWDILARKLVCRVGYKETSLFRRMHRIRKCIKGEGEELKVEVD
jgi:hypothetical protein